MSQRKLPKPSIATYPLHKAMLLALFVGVMLLLLSAGFAIPVRGELMFSATDVVGGIVSFALAVFNWLSWRPRRSYALRWTATLMGNAYLSFLLLLVSLSYWTLLLSSGWSAFVNIVFVGLFVIAWFLPVISSITAKRFAAMQDKISFSMLKFGGPAALMVTAGILGASFGLHSPMESKVIFLAFMFPLVSISWAQYASSYLWPYRPWAKEEDE